MSATLGILPRRRLSCILYLHRAGQRGVFILLAGFTARWPPGVLPFDDGRRRCRGLPVPRSSFPERPQAGSLPR
jgi:hypothetical protein